MQLETYPEQFYDRQIQVHNNIYCSNMNYTISITIKDIDFNVKSIV